MEFSTIYDVHFKCDQNGRCGQPYRSTRHMEHEMLDAIEERMKQDDETMVTQLVKMLGERGFKMHMVERARKTQEDAEVELPRQPVLLVDPERQQRKEGALQWAKDNLHSSFDDVVWTDESTIQLENNRTFSYRKDGSASKPKPRGKHPFKVMVWAGISKKGATIICLLGCSVNSAVYQALIALTSRAATKWQVPTGHSPLPHL